MNYVKPQLNVMGSPLDKIESSSKGTINMDNDTNCPTKPVTATAYEADE
jgi:hypothetical protein